MPSAEPLQELMGWATKDDQELRVQVRKLAWSMLNEAYAILESGRPQDKMALISRLVPPMMRALGEDDQSGRGIDELRSDLRIVLAEVRGEHHPDGAPPVDPG